MTLQTPDNTAPMEFYDPEAAVDRLITLYEDATGFLRKHFAAVLEQPPEGVRIRAFYPEVRFQTSSYARVDSRLSYGHVSSPGTYAATITRPDLFRNYLTQQIGLLISNHNQPVLIGPSETPIPIHFAITGDAAGDIPQ